MTSAEPLLLSVLAESVLVVTLEQLPATAWEEPTLRAFVPSWYAACWYDRFEPFRAFSGY